MTENILLSRSKPYFDEIYNLCVGLTCSPGKAAKLISHIFRETIIFYDYHQPSDIRMWLFRIALNLYGRFYISNDADINDTIDSDFEKLNPVIDKIEIEKTLKLLSEKNFLKLFSEIPSDLRVVLVLRVMINMSYKEISTLVDVPEGTVAVRLNRARKFLFMKLSGGEK